MTLPQADLPPLSWEVLRSMMANTTWSEAWREAGSWAFRVLEKELGGDWPAAVAGKSPTGGAPQLAWAAGHVTAYAQVLELALRLELLRGSAGYAKVRRALRNDPRPSQLVHCEMQLEVAGLALRSGITPELEPAPSGGRPADVAIAVEDQRLVIETRAILASDHWRDENDWTDQLFERIHRIETEQGVRCEGEISTLLNEQAAEVLLSAIETRARMVAARIEPPPMRTPGVAIQIVPQSHKPGGGLRGPEMRGDSWARIAPRIHQKVEAAVESGASWLRLDARDGLWQFTEWSTRPLAEKLQLFDAAVRGLLGGLDGIIVSCGPLLAQGTFDDEDVVLAPGLVALRRCLPFVRVRETLIIAADIGTAEAAVPWVRLYSDEPSWLDWALGRAGLPSTNEILAR
jgi:hypothetical protein